ncbi:unnamed protein product [Prorocentrum cordatum]|uniref:Uncharacterized protein n=1 Tax=Prorocentrum cordatum TaxID=2364126 RepID=A0ABN9XK93_9DINO|nr:unnamed protein product [Polarella glacialis]
MLRAGIRRRGRTGLRRGEEQGGQGRGVYLRAGEATSLQRPRHEWVAGQAAAASRAAKLHGTLNSGHVIATARLVLQRTGSTTTTTTTTTTNQSALRQRQGLRAARAAAPPPRAEDPGRRDWEKAHQCGARVAALSAAPVRPGSSSTPVLCRATSGGHLVVGVVVCP